MDFSKLKVLVLDGGGKQTLAMVRGLKELDCYVAVLCSSKTDICYVSNKPDEIILKEGLSVHEDSYIEFIISLIASKKYDVLMPIGEMSTNTVTKYENEFKIKKQR